MKRFLKQLTKKIFNFAGLDISKTYKSSKYSLLGLKNFSIRTIIDVGANTGQFAKMISDFFPEANIYSFEPLLAPFKELKSWADSQNGRVKVFNIAVGDKEGEIEVFNHLDHSASSSILKTTNICEKLYPFTEKQNTIKVKLTTLDKAIDPLSNELTSDILIKLDVQGYEDRVIRGGVETFDKAKACIVEVSLDQLYENQATFREIVLLLNKLRFRYVGNLSQIYANDGHVISIDAVFVRALKKPNS